MIQNCDYKGDEKSKQSYLRLNYYLEKYQADQQWLLTVCATLNPALEVFKREYRYVPEKNDQAGMHVYRPMVSNADNFFSNLPVLS